MRSPDVPSKLFVAGLGDNRKADLSRVFSKYGEVLSVYVDEKKQFGFVEFASSSEAQQALQHVNHMKVNGSRLRVEYARSEKGSRDSRRSTSRERPPSSNVYDHMQVTANRLPSSVPSYRPNYYPYPHSSMLMSSSAAISRGRSLTPPSLKHSARMGAMPGEFYAPYHHGFYVDPSFYRPYDDPYGMQRLPPLPSRSYGHPYASSSSDFARYSATSSAHRRSRSRSRDRRRTSPERRSRLSRERKPKRKQSRSPSPLIIASRDRTHRSRKRSPSGSSPTPSTPDQKPSSPSTDGEEEKSATYRNSQDNNSNQKYSKRRRNE